MAISSAFTTPAKLAFLKGEILASHTYKIPLYTSSATLDATTGSYSATNEVASGAGYTTTGNTLASYAATSSGTTAFLDWADTSWTTASFTAAGCTIYDDTDTVGPDRVLCTISFGGDKTVTSGTFTIQFPTPDATNAILRLA
jgi:hypothetical protein